MSQKKLNKRGLFITFEGGEGSGKTTLIEGIYHLLISQGHQVIKTREPGSTKLGEKVRELLLSKKEMDPMAELCLFLGARAQHIDEVIFPSIQAGTVILCDRFNDSTIAYQGVARDLGKKQISQMCAIGSISFLERRSSRTFSPSLVLPGSLVLMT